MTRPRIIASAVAGLMLLIAYLLIHGASPELMRHERAYSLRDVMLNQAALQRDVLQARAGLLRNYDPIVRSMARLRAAADELRAAVASADVDTRRAIERPTHSLIAAMNEQEGLVERFKSSNALLQNSLSFFTHASRELAAGSEAATVMEALSNAMLRLTADPQGEAAVDVTASLDHLGRIAAQGNVHDSILALDAHGRLIVATLPTVDALVSGVLAAPIADRTAALQAAYFDIYGRAADRARLFRALLYIAAALLAGYVCYLFLRLQANARALHEAQRLQAVGTLAGGIAHEFNNILGAILGHCEMALAALKRASPARRNVEQAMTAGQRAATVIDQMLTFSRRRERQHRPFAAQPVVSEAIDLLRASLPAAIDIRADLNAGDARVDGDAAQLQQVVMNLSQNAAHAMDGRGTVAIALDTVESVERALSHGTLAAGRHIRLAVADAGTGIDAATMQRMFEPFFTTKAAGSGTGLGLPTVYGIVSAHQGAIHVASEVGAGTRFEVYLPRTQAPVPRERPEEGDVPAGHGETVLLVDDEAALVRLGEDMLASLGYEPVGFDRSAAALAAFRADPQRFDLVLTDEVMPGMSGAELAQAVHELRPELPVVLMTGYARPEEIARSGIREVIRKPLLSATIARCLARYIGNPVPSG
jgi:signal transduction histidine kinase/CheY-like chemotaxis protein